MIYYKLKSHESLLNTADMTADGEYYVCRPQDGGIESMLYTRHDSWSDKLIITAIDSQYVLVQDTMDMNVYRECTSKRMNKKFVPYYFELSE
jgi:hypothetical protein